MAKKSNKIIVASFVLIGFVAGFLVAFLYMSNREAKLMSKVIYLDTAREGQTQALADAFQACSIEAFENGIFKKNTEIDKALENGKFYYQEIVSIKKELGLPQQ